VRQKRIEEEGAVRQKRGPDTEGHGMDRLAEEGAVRQKRIEEEGAVRQKRGAEGNEATDAEGHMFLSDTNASREIAKARSAEVERAARDRRLQKEARPNRQNG
jgi:hypothetical protein